MSNANILQSAGGPEFFHGWTVVGATAVQIETKGFKFDIGIWFSSPGTPAPAPNTAGIWIGRDIVTADKTAGTGGTVILPGGELFLPLTDGSLLWAVSTAASQDLSWFGI